LRRKGKKGASWWTTNRKKGSKVGFRKIEGQTKSKRKGKKKPERGKVRNGVEQRGGGRGQKIHPR